MGINFKKTFRGTVIGALIIFLGLFSQQSLGSSAFPEVFFSYGGLTVLGIFLFFFMAFSFIE